MQFGIGNTADIVLENNKKEIQIVIADRGPGIPEEQMETIFEPFARLERSRSRDTGGIGLGLAITRTTVQAHGGEIVLNNRPGGRLRDCVHLPKKTDRQTVFLSEESVQLAYTQVFGNFADSQLVREAV